MRFSICQNTEKNQYMKNGGGNVQSTLANNQIKLKSFVARENRMYNAMEISAKSLRQYYIISKLNQYFKNM